MTSRALTVLGFVAIATALSSTAKAQGGCYAPSLASYLDHPMSSRFSEDRHVCQRRAAVLDVASRPSPDRDDGGHDRQSGMVRTAVDR